MAKTGGCKNELPALDAWRIKNFDTESWYCFSSPRVIPRRGIIEVERRELKGGIFSSN